MEKMELSPKMWKKESQWHIFLGLSENTEPKSSGFSSFSMLKWPQFMGYLPGLKIAGSSSSSSCGWSKYSNSKYFAFLIPSILMSPHHKKTHHLGRVSVLLRWGGCFRWFAQGLPPFNNHSPTLHPGRQSSSVAQKQRLRVGPLLRPRLRCASSISSVSIDLVDHPSRSVTEYTSLLINTYINTLIFVSFNM